MNLYQDFLDRIDKVGIMLEKQLDPKTIKTASEDLAKIFIDLTSEYRQGTLTDNEWIALSVVAYNIRDALLLLK